MRYILPILITLTALTGCSRHRNSVEIEGNIEGLKPDTATIYLYGCDVSYERIDTITATNGHFKVKANVDTLTLLTLRLNDRISYPIFADKGDKIEIEGTLNGGNAKIDVKGSELNEKLSEIMNTLNNRDSIAKRPLKRRVKEYIAANPSSLVSAYLLTRYLAYDNDADIDDIESQIKKLSGSLHDNTMISTLNEQLQVAKRGTNGKFAPLFRLKNANGEDINRNKNFKDKYLLITFWASWDDSSRSNNAALRKLKRDMKNEKEFDMLGVALDMDKDEWKNAVEKDSLSWQQACETEMFNSDIAEQYGVTTLPLNILIDPNGKIVSRGIPTDSVPGKVRGEIKKKKEAEAEAKKKK
jgi:peroxiredoxin